MATRIIARETWSRFSEWRTNRHHRIIQPKVRDDLAAAQDLTFRRLKAARQKWSDGPRISPSAATIAMASAIQPQLRSITNGSSAPGPARMI